MFKPLKHPHVRILEGVTQLVGLTGLIVDKEGKLYRVNLGTPTEVPGAGLVSTDLFMPSALKVIKPKPAAAAPEAAAEVAPVAPAPQPAPAADAAEAATPATPAATAGKPKARKPKALSAKQEAQKRAGVKVTDDVRRPA